MNTPACRQTGINTDKEVFATKGKWMLPCIKGGNLVAFACKLSFQKGHEGNVSFISKTQLIEHYIESLGAIHFGGRLMIIETTAALKLINKYYPL